MAHESFEDEEIGRLMNDTFIETKVSFIKRPISSSSKAVSYAHLRAHET